jgi:SOS-response transcriptional repressor LexA
MRNKAVRRQNLLALEQEHRSLAELERKTGVSASYLSQVKGGYREMGDRVARTIEGKLHLGDGWMDVPRTAERQSDSNVEPFREPRAKLPLISWVSAGGREEANDPYLPGAAEAWIEFDTLASKSAFCLRVRGISMVRPDGTGFPDGCLIAVEPARKPASGDFVVVRFNDDNEATFKQYFVEGRTKYLRPLNPSYPTLMVSPDAQMVGVVFEKRVIEKF